MGVATAAVATVAVEMAVATVAAATVEVATVAAATVAVETAVATVAVEMVAVATVAAAMVEVETAVATAAVEMVAVATAGVAVELSYVVHSRRNRRPQCRMSAPLQGRHPHRRRCSPPPCRRPPCSSSHRGTNSRNNSHKYKSSRQQLGCLCSTCSIHCRMSSNRCRNGRRNRCSCTFLCFHQGEAAVAAKGAGAKGEVGEGRLDVQALGRSRCSRSRWCTVSTRRPGRRRRTLHSIGERTCSCSPI